MSETTHSAPHDVRPRPDEMVIRDIGALAGCHPIIDANLRDYSRWRAGGRARILVSPTSANSVQQVLSYLADHALPRLVIGDGSNILFDDEGFDGVVVHIGRGLSALRIDGSNVWAEAGLWVPHFVRKLAQHGLRGAEHAVGIPGTLGGLIIMNGGSRRMGIGSNIVNVSGCDLGGVPFERAQLDCQFRYRGSTLQDDGLIVLGAQFSFELGDPKELRREMIEIMSDRRRKFPKSLPNCGSVFLSDPAMYSKIGPPGSAIERAGLKGHQIGEAQISPQHANFIVNLGNARSDDILRLIHLTRNTVHDQTGFWMDAEVRHISRTGIVRAAHLAAADLV